MQQYHVPPPATFWSDFPSRPFPLNPGTQVNIDGLKQEVDSVSGSWLDSQNRRASVLFFELENGAKLPFSTTLPALTVPNTASVNQFGNEFTDTLAHWINKGFVSGPFPSLPTVPYRSNSMMAVEQKQKVRIVMNLSAPKGTSFNDAIDDLQLEKICMSSARKFGYSVLDCGVGAKMWKYDMVDAYKNIPATGIYVAWLFVFRISTSFWFESCPCCVR